MTQAEDILQPENPSTTEGFSESTETTVPSKIPEPMFKEEEDEKYQTEESREYDATYMDTLPGQ